MNEQPKPNKKPFFYYAMIAMLILMLLNAFVFPSLMTPRVTEVSYDKFLDMLSGGQVTVVELQENERELYFKAADENGAERIYSTGVFPDADLQKRLSESGVTFSAVAPQENSTLMNFLFTWIFPTLILILPMVLLWRMMQKRMGDGSNMMSFGMGKSNAKMYVAAQTGKTFADVAGQEEAKEALEEIVDFLHNPDKYRSVGAVMPKGVLLVGPPGTGKTLLAKAVAGEANVPFFSIAGSEFVEMFVGQGAARVRDLFKQAKEKAPCIVFIDEIDTIGKKRDGSGIAGNDEREQTLNQLLSEMDGFDGSSGVVILAATNRPETLDKALLRPGRFDRRVPVELPDLQGREAILRVHAKDVMMADDIDYKAVARATSGASGAELANLINEAALRAVKCNRRIVTQEDLTESVDVVVAGYQRKNAVLSPHEKEIVAYHEIGHAPVQFRARDQDHHRAAHLGCAGLYDADAGGRHGAALQGRGAGEDRHADGRAQRRGADLRQRHQRRVQRHRAGHQAGPQHGNAPGHERNIRYDGAGDREQPVSGRRRSPGVQCRDRHQDRQRGGGDHPHSPRKGHRHFERQHG